MTVGNDEWKSRVTKMLAEEIGPALQLDGAGIELVDFQDGVLQVRLGNVCASCPSTIMTVIMGLEQELRQRFPEIDYLEAIA
jgi:Fe-S cluster biogenesis protein NfuA